MSSSQTAEPVYSSLYEQIQFIDKIEQTSIFLIRGRDAPRQYLIARKTPIYSLDEVSQNEIFNECKLLKSLSHPHIIRYVNIYLEQDELIVVMEYCEQGDLAHYLKKRIDRKDYLSDRLILNWLLQLLMALNYIHQNKILHRGLSLENIFLTAKGNIKLGSFGHSKMLESTNAMAKTSIGKLGYMSPEMFESKPYDSKSDMWAVGCILYELCTFSPLFDDKLPVTSLYDRIVQQAAPDLPPQYMKSIYPIYKKLLKKAPTARPNASDLLSKPLFVALMEDYLKKKRIDALDLREIPPKKLAIHDKMTEARKKTNNGFHLPPLANKNTSNSFQQRQACHSSNSKNQLEGSVVLSEKSVQSQPCTTSMSLSSSRGSLHSKSKEKPGFLKSKHKSSYEQEDHTGKVTHLPSLQSSAKASPRLTSKNQQEEYNNIEQLYRIQINIICKDLELKYGPKMDQILERTLEYDPEDY